MASDIVARVCAVMSDVGAITKDRENPHFKYMYVSAEAVRARVQRACVKHGLILRLTYSEETVSLTSATLKCTCSVSMDGETFVVLGEGWGAGSDKAEKACLKANTSAAKYAISNAFCIALGEDPEADAETDRPAKDDRLDAAEHARAEKQAAARDEHTLTGKAMADEFRALTCRPDVLTWAKCHWAAFQTLPEPIRRKVWAVVLKTIETVKDIGITSNDLKAEISRLAKEE